MISCSDEEWRLRRDLAACFRLLAYFRMTDLIYTHATLRVPGAEHCFLINPFGLLFEEIRASDLLKIGPDGRPVDSGPGLVNLAGFVIHGAIHAARADVHCVVHTHTRAGCAIAAQRDGLLPINQISLEFYQRVAYHEYEGIAFDFDEQQRLIRDVADKPVVILRNHGLLTLGGTLPQAFLRMYYLEKACEIQLAAQSTGQALSLPSAEVCRRTERQFSAPPPTPNEQLVSDPDGLDLSWQALLRMLDRLDPSYKE
jgi:ribulose-5-phosphate 4-epimerase/fuculose-1-phosphate aldolase